MSKKDDHTTKPSKQKPSKKPAESAALQEEIDALTERLMRERADSENLRRRHEAQLSDLKKYVKAEVIRELLPSIDNIDRALTHTPKDLANNDYVKGVKGIAKQFQATLKKLGVEKIATVGEEFNPELHEAVSMDDSGPGDTEIVAEELQSGYIVEGTVIRHAMVKVRLGKK